MRELFLTERLVKLEQIAAGIRRQFGKAGGQNDRQVAALGSDGVGKLRSRHEWHRLIGNDDVDILFAPEHVERLLARSRFEDRVAEVLQHRNRVHQDERVVVDGKDHQ